MKAFVASITGDLQYVQDRDLLLNFLQSYDMIEVSKQIATDEQKSQEINGKRKIPGNQVVRGSFLLFDHSQPVGFFQMLPYYLDNYHGGVGGIQPLIMGGFFAGTFE